jgi:hypothetical protein
MIRADEVKVGDVFKDIRVTVGYSEPFSDMLWALDCYVEGTNGFQTITLIFPREHQVNVYRL